MWNKAWFVPFLMYRFWQFGLNDYSGTGTQTAHFESYVPWKRFLGGNGIEYNWVTAFIVPRINKFHGPGTAASRNGCRLAFRFQNLFLNG